VPEPDAQATQVLAEAAPKLHVFAERRMKSRCRRRDEAIDHDLVVGLRRETRVDELDESEKEPGDGGYVGLAEDQVHLLLHPSGDPRRSCRDGMVDERA